MVDSPHQPEYPVATTDWPEDSAAPQDTPPKTSSPTELHKAWVTLIRDYATIAAFVLGSIWALFTFMQKDLPALSVHHKADATLKWAHGSKDSIHAEFNVTITNSGTTAFAVDSARLCVYVLDSLVGKVQKGQKLRYMDANAIIANSNCYFDTLFKIKADKNYATPELGLPFLQKYDAATDWTENFDFTFLRNPDHLALFYLKVYKHDRDSDWAYQWSPIGGKDTSQTIGSKYF